MRALCLCSAAIFLSIVTGALTDPIDPGNFSESVYVSGANIGSITGIYWAIGDNGNGSGANADLTSLASKIGRANRTGTVPGDNPFVDGAGPNNDYIWARGFRNPFTFTFQRSTGQLWSNTVGTNWEQVF